MFLKFFPTQEMEALNIKFFNNNVSFAITTELLIVWFAFGTYYFSSQLIHVFGHRSDSGRLEHVQTESLQMISVFGNSMFIATLWQQCNEMADKN